MILAASIFLSLQLWPLAQEKEESKEVKNPLGKDKAAIAAGREIYGSTCAACHGTTGQGGRGPRLADAVRGVRDMSDKKVFDVIKEGVKGTQMPPFSLPDTQIWQMVSFIRSLNATAIDEDIPGNLAAGEALFFGGGKCSECHMIHGHGGLIGPDLSNLGVERSAKKIEERRQNGVTSLHSLEFSLLWPATEPVRGHSGTAAQTAAPPPPPTGNQSRSRPVRAALIASQPNN